MSSAYEGGQWARDAAEDRCVAALVDLHARGLRLALHGTGIPAGRPVRVSVVVTVGEDPYSAVSDDAGLRGSGAVHSGHGGGG